MLTSFDCAFPDNQHAPAGRCQRCFNFFVPSAIAQDFLLPEFPARDGPPEKMLLEQMKEADVAQASNPGQTLAPAIASRFEDLTQCRCQHLQINAELGTEGVAVAVRLNQRTAYRWYSRATLDIVPFGLCRVPIYNCRARRSAGTE
jgi:hypothetical protein